VPGRRENGTEAQLRKALVDVAAGDVVPIMTRVFGE
jgi:hypothetical protein